MCFKYEAPFKRTQHDQQLPTLLDVTCCVRLHILLHVVIACCSEMQSLKPIKLLATCKRTQRLPTMLGVAWPTRLRPLARGLRGLRRHRNSVQQVGAFSRCVIRKARGFSSQGGTPVMILSKPELQLMTTR